MNTTKISKALEKMRGHTFQYGNTIHYVLDFKLDESNQKCFIKTNLNTFERPFENIEEFLCYWHPISNTNNLPTEESNQQQVAVYIEQDNTLTSSLITTLNDNIQKIQTNKDYIPQAQAINNNINTIVNIIKMRLDVVKHFQKGLSLKKVNQ